MFNDNLKKQLHLALAQSEQQRKPRSFVAIDGLFVEVNVNSQTTLTIWRRRPSDLTVTDWIRFNEIWPYPLAIPPAEKITVEDKLTTIKRTVWRATWPTPPRLLDAEISSEEITR